MSDERKHGTKNSEISEIKRMGAKAQANSGRGKVNKGDAVLDGYWLVDVKEFAKTYSISIDNWAKICTDAIRSGNYEPALNVVLGEGGGPRVRLFVISEDEMNEYRRLRLAEEKRIMEDNNG